MIRAGRTIAAIVLACLVAGDPAVASTWDQALVTSLIDQGRDAEAIALCDAAIDLAHAPGGVEDLDILSAGRDAASTKYGILRRTKAAIPEIIDALDTALSFEVTMEWHGLIEIMPGEPKFGPEWIPRRKGLELLVLSSEAGDAGRRVDLAMGGVQLLVDAVEDRWRRSLDHPGTPDLVYDANNAITETWSLVDARSRRDVLIEQRLRLFDVVDDLAARGRLRLFTEGQDDLSFGHGDSMLGSLIGTRMETGPIEVDFVASVQSWLDSIPDEDWRSGPGYGVVSNAGSMVGRVVDSGRYVEGIDVLAETLLRIRGLLPDRQEAASIASDRITASGALLLADRYDDARLMLDRIPNGLDPSIDFMTMIVRRNIDAADVGAPIEENPLPMARASSSETSSVTIEDATVPGSPTTRIEAVPSSNQPEPTATNPGRSAPESPSSWTLAWPAGLLGMVVLGLGWFVVRRPNPT